MSRRLPEPYYQWCAFHDLPDTEAMRERYRTHMLAILRAPGGEYPLDAPPKAWCNRLYRLLEEVERTRATLNSRQWPRMRAWAELRDHVADNPEHAADAIYRHAHLATRHTYERARSLHDNTHDVASVPLHPPSECARPLPGRPQCAPPAGNMRVANAYPLLRFAREGVPPLPWVLRYAWDAVVTPSQLGLTPYLPDLTPTPSAELETLL